MHVRDYRPGDETAIADLFRTCFNRDRSLDEWRWRYVDAPVERVDIHILCSDDEVVGHLGGVGYPTFVNAQRMVCRLPGDAMVRPDHRGRRGYHMLLEAMRQLPYDLRIVFPNDATVRQQLPRGDYTFIDTLPQWLTWRTRPVDAALRFIARTRLTLEPMDEPGPDVDALGEDSRHFAACIRVRDARYVRWRWLDHPAGDWRIIAARDRGAGLRGFVVFGVDAHHDDGRLGRIVDILVRDAVATRALLHAAAHELSSRGCSLIALDYQDPRPWSKRACYLSGFVRRGSGPTVAGKALTERARPWGDSLASWYVTRGDTDLC